MAETPRHPLPPPPGQPADPFTDRSYAVPLTPAAPRPPFASYQSASALPNSYRDPNHQDQPYPYPSRPVSNEPSSNVGGLTPYLGLPARLLLASLSPALLPIILTIVHLSTNRRSTADMADSLRSSMYAACTGLAKGAGTLQTIPRYMAMQTNEQMVRVTQGLILATGMGLIHMVTIIETVVIFVINTYRSLLVCTIELAVRGTLELMIGAVRGISQAVTESLDEIRNAIQASVSGANNVIQETVSRLSRATSLIGIDLSIPQFTIPELSRLSNVTIPNDFEQSLVRLNGSIPSLDELRSKLDSIISQPFSLLKAEMNETRLELASGFNSTLLPTPPMSALSADASREMENSLCGDLDTSLVDEAASALRKLSNTAIGLMCLLLFLCWAALCIWEWYRWKCLKDSVETVQHEWRAEGRADAWRAVAVIENPVLEKYGSPALRRLARKERTRTNVRWYLSYLSHPTTLTLLFISLLCLISLQLQLVALNALKAHAQSNADAAVNASTKSLTSKLNDMALAQSKQYAADYNAVVGRYQTQMDERLIGHWVNTTGVALNTTLNEFYDDVEDIVNRAFGNTVLAQPMQTFLYCILGSKIDSLSRALTWLRDNARIELPLLPDNVLMLSPESMNEMASPISAAAVGSSPSGGADGDDGIVGKLIGHWEKAIQAEMIVYAILIGVWGALALIGLIAVAWHSGPGDRFRRRREGGQQRDAAMDEKYAVDMADVGRGTNEKAPIHDPYASHDNTRGTPTRSGSALSTRLASLVGPGDRFLKFGRQTPGPGSEQGDHGYNTAGVGAGAGLTGNAAAAATGHYGDKERLVHSGDTSESYNNSNARTVPMQRHDTSYPYYNYNHHTSTANKVNAGAVRDSQLESPPAFWFKRAAGAAMSPIRSFFPSDPNGREEGFGSRGEKHGRAIHLRGAEGETPSGKYERMREGEEDARPSFEHGRALGASRQSRGDEDGRYDDADAPISVALGGQEYHASPVPTTAADGTQYGYPSYYNLSAATPNFANSPVPSLPPKQQTMPIASGTMKKKDLTFPRPMSRASTHYDGRTLDSWRLGTGTGPGGRKAAAAPALPADWMDKKASANANAGEEARKDKDKHDSVDMLYQDEQDGEQRQRVEGWLGTGAGHVDPFADADEERYVPVQGKGKGRKNPFTDIARI